MPSLASRTFPAVADGVAYVGSGERLYAIDTECGAIEWQYDMGAVVDSSAAVVDGVIYLVSKDHLLRALE